MWPECVLGYVVRNPLNLGESQSTSSTLFADCLEHGAGNEAGIYENVSQQKDRKSSQSVLIEAKGVFDVGLDMVVAGLQRPAPLGPRGSMVSGRHFQTATQ
jgi:hypothetical protein